MGFLWKKEKSIINKVIQYTEQLDIACEKFLSCMKDQIDNPVDQRDNDLVESVHTVESKADDIRRDIEYQLYNKALLPESRGDILGLLETMDKIPNDFQSIAYQISLQKIEIPSELKADFHELIEVNIKAYRLIKDAFQGFFYKKAIKPLFNEIDQIESDSDRTERKIIKKIFDMDIDKADRLLLKELTVNIGDISDRAESCADRLNLAIVKRRI